MPDFQMQMVFFLFLETHISQGGHPGIFLLVSVLEFQLQFCKYQRCNQNYKTLIKSGI